ncbi:4'-phosphopantetheinyl transferase superfamily protein [Jinshanibacter sp. LJY008]|uniref:4'-phosphopantetheinyl transferase superfamily protein n=2 Tax=Limnobaculum eriocheiris TaxID=2897391 RepID=A0A9X1MW25_9GAMM|nr:4'-phosphopantetheinyl transferase superfamily protein [Limnobaculum eriocheiris]
MNLNSTKITIATLRLPNEEWLPSMQSRLPLSIRQQGEQFNPKRRQQFISGRWLLAELMFHQLGCSELPAVLTSDNGRPIFIDAGLPDFNISHSGEYIMVALTQNARIGLDVEHIRPRRKLMELAQYSFSDNEYQWLRNLPESKQTDGFWQLWTLRESVLKLSAKGVWQMKQIQVMPQEKKLFADFQPELFCITSRHQDIAWAISTNLPIQHIESWLADSEKCALIPMALPELVGFTTPK